MNKQFIDKQKLAEQFSKESGQVGVGYIDDLIDKQPVAFDMDMVVDQVRRLRKIQGNSEK